MHEVLRLRTKQACLGWCLKRPAAQHARSIALGHAERIRSMVNPRSAEGGGDVGKYYGLGMGGGVGELLIGLALI